MIGTEPAQQTTPSILLVDDEAIVLKFVGRCLDGQGYHIAHAASGSEALQTIEQNAAPAVVVADMHMPGMTGAALLSEIRTRYPETVRMLLTGYADVNAAIEAVNRGQIFRFLTKPCPPEVMVAAVAAAVEQHRLITTERILLEQTLQGTIQTLVDVLSMTNSNSFGRATRIQRTSEALAAQIGAEPMWQLGVSAMLSQFGAVTLPQELTDRAHAGRALSPEEATVVARLPVVTEHLLMNIPRLEVVRAILAQAAGAEHMRDLPLSTYRLSHDDLERAMLAGNIVRLAADFDTLELRGLSRGAALAQLQRDTDRHATVLLDALTVIVVQSPARVEVQEVKLKDVRVGMVLADDLMTAAGSLLVVRGYEFTSAFVARCHGYPPGWLKEPVKVFVKP